jgi:hypothetical protein
MLAGPVAALVVDLRSIPRRHLRLLQVARQLAVPAIGVGNVPAGLSTDQLDGLRLAGTHSLISLLGELLHETSNAPATPAETLQPKDNAPVELEPEDADRHPADASAVETGKGFDQTMRVLATRSMLDGLYVCESPEPRAETNDQQPLSAEPVDASDTGDEGGRTRDPRELLTPQELSALLEKTR